MEDSLFKSSIMNSIGPYYVEFSDGFVNPKPIDPEPEPEPVEPEPVEPEPIEPEPEPVEPEPEPVEPEPKKSKNIPLIICAIVVILALIISSS